MPVYDARGGRNVHIDRVLTNISLEYPNEGFVGENLVKPVRVRKQSDKYYEFGLEKWGQEPSAGHRAPGAEADEIPGLEVSLNPYFATERAFQIGVADEERENADAPLDPDRDGTELVTSRVLLARELEIRNLFTTIGNYASGLSTTLGSDTHWDEYDEETSTPIADIKTGKRAMHAEAWLAPTVTVIPWRVMSFLEDHPDIIERIKYSQAGVLTEDIIARVFGVRKVVVPGAGYNTAAMGQAEALDYIWGDDVVMAHVPQRAGLRIPAAAYEFVWPIAGQVQAVDRWREQKRVRDVIRVRRRYDIRFIATDSNGDTRAAYLIKGTLSS